MAVDARMQNVDLGPLVVITPAIQLAAPIRTNRRHKFGSGYFFVETEKSRAVKIVRPVSGKTITRPRPGMTQHRDSCRIGGEMSVDVIHSLPGEPAEEHACLHEISEVDEHSAVGT